MSQRIVFITNSDNVAGIQFIKDILISIEQKDYALMCLGLQGTDFSTIDANYGSGEWLSVKEMNQKLQESSEMLDKSTSSLFSEHEKTSDLASQLHNVADSQTYLGDSLQVILALDDVDIDCTKSFVPLSGSFLRLRHWHNARFTFLKTEHQLSSLAQQLQEITQGVSTTDIETINFSCPRWEGKVVLFDRVEEQGCEFGGHYLECNDWNDFLENKLPQIETHPVNGKGKNMKKVRQNPSDIVFGRSIEVLQEIDLRTLPWILYDEFELKLNIFDGSDSILHDHIKGLKETGLLARLRIYFNRSELPTCGKLKFMNTMAWKDRILSDCQNIQEPQEQSIGREFQYIYFVLFSREDKTIVAKTLLSPHEINKDVVDIFQHCQTFLNKNKKAAWEKPSIGNLPVVEIEKFQILLNQMVELNCDENNAQEKFEETFLQALEGCITLTDYMSRHKQDICQTTQIDWIPETSLDLSLLPEKRALVARESSSRKLRRYMSMDSQPAASPIAPFKEEKKSKPGHFTIDDILNVLRKEDSIMNIPPGWIKMTGRNLCRVDSQCDLKTPWPNSQSLRYHDIYFYNSEEDMKFERRYARVRDKGHFDGTSSSFVSPIKKNIKSDKMRLAMSPTRSSPRRRALLMSRSKSEMCQVSLSGQTETLFKQPKAMPYSKSPRKRLSSSPMPNSDSSDGSRLNRNLSFNSSLLSNNLVRKSPRKHDTCHSTSVSSQKPSLKRSFSLSEDLPVQYKGTLSSNSTARSGFRSPRKRLALSSDFASDSEEPKSLVHKRLQSDETAVRRSPRKSHGREKRDSHIESLSGDISIKRHPSSSSDVLTTSQSKCDGKDAKLKRSQRHKMKLQSVIIKALEEKGIGKENALHKACLTNVFNVSMVLLKTLPNSQNLKEEMKNVVYSQVQQIINLEKRRCGIAI